MEERETTKAIKDGSEISDDHLDGIEQKLAGGLRFTNLLASMNQENIGENKVLLHALVEILVGKGLIHVHELEQRKKALVESFNQSDEQKPRVHLVDTPDKYAQDNELLIDCAGCHSVCKGVCCKMWFALSVQDLEERIVRWNYSYPYGIAQDQDGYCVHFDHSTHKCGIYENRPLVCRSYDCRQDKRIWLDFENRVPNPEVDSRLQRKDTPPQDDKNSTE